MSLRSIKALGVQRRHFAPCVAITGFPLPMANSSNGSRSYVAWESMVQPKDKRSLEKYGPIAGRANSSKLSDPGIDAASVIEFNTYPEGSTVARNDRLGKDVENLMHGYPITDEGYLKKYLKPRTTDDYQRRVEHYAMLAVPRTIGVFMTKSVVCGLIMHMGPRAGMKPLAVEVDLSPLKDGEGTAVIWAGTPCFIHKRTAEQIAEAESTLLSDLRDPQTDGERHKNPKYVVVIAICTHSGCIPVFGSGNYNGYLCPCHGSHYDVSGRVRRGPAPLNLEIPPYYFPRKDTLCIGQNSPYDYMRFENIAD